MCLFATFSTECHYAEYRYADCRSDLNVMLSVVMLSDIMLNVVMLSVLAPCRHFAYASIVKI